MIDDKNIKCKLYDWNVVMNIDFLISWVYIFLNVIKCYIIVEDII